MKYYHLPLIATLCLLASCTAKVPGHYTEVDKNPDIHPNKVAVEALELPTLGEPEEAVTYHVPSALESL